MVEEKEFLSLEELTSQTNDFKKKWYGLTQKAESLSNFKSGFDEGFKSDIKAIYEDIDACKDYVDGFEHSLKHYFPDRRSDITWMTKKIYRHLEELRVMAKKDYDVLENSKELAHNLKGLSTELEKAEVKFKAAEEKSGESCRKYFDMKSDYTTARQAVDDKINKQLDKIRGKFIEMTTPIIEGHDIALASRTVSITELFDLLSDKPEDVDKISLLVKKGGLFGKKAETDLAKTSVLKYVSSEILEGVPPITKDKKKQIDKLKSEFSDLPRLEKACEEDEKQRKKLEKPVEELRAKIGEIKKSEVFKFVDYDGILETREQYVDKIKESEKEVREYLDFALLNLKGFAELESDVEKRNLLVEIKTAKEKAVSEEKEASKAREELSAKVKELNKVTASKESLEKKLEGITKRVKEAEKETAEAKKMNEAVLKKAGEFEKLVSGNLQRFQTEMASKIKEITSAMQPASDKTKAEAKVEKKMDTLRGKKK